MSKAHLSGVRDVVRVADMRQVGLSPERPESSALEQVPPWVEHIKVSVRAPCMDLNLHLTNRQGWGAGQGVRAEESIKHRELSTFDVDLQEVNEVVSVLLHDSLNGVLWRAHVWLVFSSGLVWEEV